MLFRSGKERKKPISRTYNYYTSCEHDRWLSMRARFSARCCYVEFVLEHSPSVSVRLRLFPSVLRPSITFFLLSDPFSSHPLSVLCFRHFRLILSAFHIRIRPVFSEFRPRFIVFPLLFGYNPYQPNPVAPRPLIVFCLLLYYVPLRINYDKL